MAKRNCHGWHLKGICHIVTVGFILCLGPPGLQADAPPDRGSGSSPPSPGPPSPRDDGPASDAPPPDLTHLTAQRTALNPLLVRDRRHRLLLSRGATALQEGHSLEGITHLQALLDAPQDAFFWIGNDSQPRGARSDVIGWFHSSPESVRCDYERLYGDSARELFMRYRETRDDRLLVELIRRFGPTTAAREAAVSQLLFAHDTGRTIRMREWGRYLQADPFHWHRLPPTVRNLIARHVSEAVSHEVSLVQGHRPEWSQAVPSVSPALHPQEPCENLAPDPVPIWTARFDAGLPSSSARREDVDDQTAQEVAKAIGESYDAWLAHRTDDNLPIATVHEAIVAEDVLIVRDFTHVRGVNVESGHELWKYACVSSLAAAARLIEQSKSGQQGGSLDFHGQFSGNSVLGRLSTDGRCVFLLDRSTVASPSPNQLIALPLKEAATGGKTNSDGVPEAAPRWMRGALSGVDHDDLSNSAFLGCPLCVDDRLFLLAESEQQISLFALDAATGRTLWKQPVALVERPVTEDVLRQRTSCTPVYHDGIVCCPTEIGIVVGVEALTGRLEWIYDHMDEEHRANAGRWAFNSGRNPDRSLLPNHIYLQHGRLLYLPARSQDVHCLDAETGRLVWKQPRHEAHAIGGVTESCVLLLGDRECVALNLMDGGTCWRTSTPEPAGTGIVAGHRYLLPTSNGPCLSIHLQNGKIDGRRFSRLMHQLSADDQIPAGNLLEYGHLIIATTPLAVRVYPQAQHRLTQLMATATRRSLSHAEQLFHAQLLMTIGDADQAGEVLQQLLSFDPPNPIRQNSEQLFREVLYAQLEDAPDPFPTLHRLTALARSDDEQLRLQLSRLSVSLQHADATMLIEALEAMQTLPRDMLVSPNSDEEYTVSAEQSLRDRLAFLQEDERSPLSEAVADYLTDKSQEFASSADVIRLERFVSLFADWPQSRHAQSSLAEQWIAAGRLQEAEQLLLSLPVENPATTADPVSPLLAELYADTGLIREAEQLKASHWARVSQEPVWKHRLTRPAPGLELLSLQWAHPVSQLPTDLPRTAMTTPAPRFMPTYRVSEHRCHEACPLGEQCGCQLARRLRDTDGLRRVFVPQLTGSTLVLDQGINKNKRTHSRLMLVDRETGMTQGVVDVPSAYWQLPQPTLPNAGHMMIVSGEATHGISLLEAKTLWSIVPETSRRKSENIKVGPTGADYCVLQSSHELHVVHPANGRTLWKRTHLPPGIGLQGHESVGMIGDSQSLCVFDAEQTSYTLYHTQSGRKMRVGTRHPAPGSSRRHRWAVGRHLIEVLSDSTGCRLWVWDSLEDRLVTDLALAERLITPLPGDEDIACVTSEGRLLVLRAATGERLLDVPLQDQSTQEAQPSLEEFLKASSMVAFADRDRIYINLTSEADQQELKVTAPTDEVDVPHVRVRGRLFAIDRHEGKGLWNRMVPDACLPIQPESASPVLTLLSRTIDDRTNRGRGHDPGPSSLTVEVLDSATGATLARQGQLLRTRIVGYRSSSPIVIDDPGVQPHDKHARTPDPSLSVAAASPNSRLILASLIGMDSQIDIQIELPTTTPPPQVAAEERTSINR